MAWTEEQIHSWAPDSGTAERGKAVAKTSNWTLLAKNERGFWGNCKGSKGAVYETGVDLQELGFRCSCPVSRMPCKHVLGLMLLYANEMVDFEENTPPQWMIEWLEKREERATANAESDDEARKKEEARKANFQKRVHEMKIGLSEFQIWIKDMVRQGIATVEKESYSFWEDAASRLTDAKANAASNYIREIPLLINASSDWSEKVLAHLSDVYTLSEAFKQMENLPEPLQHDVLSVAGYTIQKKDLFQLKSVEDEWDVLGKMEGASIKPDVAFRRVWLRGRATKRYALLLDYRYTPSQASFETHFQVGTFFQGELFFFPSNMPIRARLKKQMALSGLVENYEGFADFQAFLTGYAKALSRNPWLMDCPCRLNNVTPVMEGDHLIFVDKNKDIIPVQNRHLMGWRLLALSGGNPISVFGEWTGSELLPLSAWVNGRFIEMSIDNTP